MAGQWMNSLTFNILDFGTIYIAISLGQCVQVSFFVFILILFLRGTLLRKTVFLKGMVWGLLLVTPFLGKLNLLYDNGFVFRCTSWWATLCSDHWWVRYGYVAGMALCAGVLFSGRRKLCRIVKNMEQSNVCGQEIKIHGLAVTPFTTGLFHSWIVIPKILQKELSGNEIETILLHERIHIRLGHLWLYLMWDILQILLWPNFFFVACRQCFQNDLEDICDKAAIQKGGQDALGYGMLLLKCMQLVGSDPVHPERRSTAFGFAQVSGYRNVRQRISRIAAFRPYRGPAAQILCIVGTAVLAGAFLLIIHNSYPRYMEETETIALAAMHQGTSVIILDRKEFEQAVSWDEDYIYINRTEMDRILEDCGIQGGGFWISFGGYRKNPRLGWSGNGTNVDYRGQEENLRVPYSNSEKNFWITLLKQMP